MSYARIAPGPKGRKAQFGATAEEADRKARELEAASREIESPLPPPTWPQGSFAAFVYEVWAPHVYPSIRATSRRSYDSMVKHHLIPAFGTWPIKSMGYDNVKPVIDAMLRADESGPLPDRRKFEVVMRLKEILTLYATLETAKGGRPREDWRIVKAPKIKRRKDRDDPPADFTERIMGACTGRFEWAKGPTFAALFLGLRRGEVAGLMWSDIDREKMTITVSEQRQPEHKEGRVPTKGDARTIPVPKGLLDRLDALGDRGSVFVFTGAKGTPVPVNELSKVTPRLCEAAGLPKVTFHDQRSFAASNLIALGEDPIAVMQILGHRKLDVTLLYVNRDREAKRKALENLLNGLTGT